MLQSFSDYKKIQNLYSFCHIFAYCISVERVNVKISWRKITCTALTIALVSVEADVNKMRIFLLEIVLLLYETQNEQNNYKHCGSQNNCRVCIDKPRRSLLQIQWRKWIDGCLAPTESLMPTDDGFVFISTSPWEKINGSCVGRLTLLWQTDSAFSYLDLWRSRTQYGMRSLNTSLIETTK
jgi:hypothetical protein